jgi:hypothetical protein
MGLNQLDKDVFEALAFSLHGRYHSSSVGDCLGHLGSNVVARFGFDCNFFVKF